MAYRTHTVRAPRAAMQLLPAIRARRGSAGGVLRRPAAEGEPVGPDDQQDLEGAADEEIGRTELVSSHRDAVQGGVHVRREHRDQEEDQSDAGNPVGGPEEEPQGVVERREVTVEEKVELLTEQIQSRRTVSFRAFISQCRSRVEVIVSFMAVLELIKSLTLRVEQDVAFGDISLIRIVQTSTPAEA